MACRWSHRRRGGACSTPERPPPPHQNRSGRRRRRRRIETGFKRRVQHTYTVLQPIALFRAESQTMYKSDPDCHLGTKARCLLTVNLWIVTISTRRFPLILLRLRVKLNLDLSNEPIHFFVRGYTLSLESFQPFQVGSFFPYLYQFKRIFQKQNKPTYYIHFTLSLQTREELVRNSRNSSNLPLLS